MAPKPEKAARQAVSSSPSTVLLACSLAGVLASVPELFRIVANNSAPSAILAGVWFAMGSMTLLATLLAALLFLVLRPLSASPLGWAWELVSRLRAHLATPVPVRFLARSLLAAAFFGGAVLAALAIVGGVLGGLLASNLPPLLAVVCGLIGVVAAVGVLAYSLLLFRRWTTSPWFKEAGGGSLVGAPLAHLHEYALIVGLCLGVPLGAHGVLDRLALLWLFDLVILGGAFVAVVLLMARVKRLPPRPALVLLLVALLAGVLFGLSNPETRSALGGRNSLAGLLPAVAAQPPTPSAPMPSAGPDAEENTPTCGHPAFSQALARARAAYKVPTGDARPDILLVTWDAARADHLSLYGYPRPTSANLDALAAKATVFDLAQSPSAKTNQAVPALLTGRHAFNVPGSFRALWFNLLDEALTFPELLQKAGYATGAVGIGGDFKPEHNWNQGFDQWIQPRDFTPTDLAGPTQVEASLETLGKLRQDPSRPVFFWVHLVDPHDRYLPHEGTPWVMKNDLDNYDSEIWFTDQNTKLIVDQFNQTTRPRIIVFLADHGEALGEHSERAHRDLYLGITHVPLVILVDGLPPGRIQVPVSTLDLFPTLLDLLGLEHPAGLDGCSLLPALVGDSIEGRGPIFSAFTNASSPRTAWVAVLDGKQRLMRELLFGTNFMFDLDADPAELKNLFGGDAPGKDRLSRTLDGFVARGSNWLTRKPR